MSDQRPSHRQPPGFVVVNQVSCYHTEEDTHIFFYILSFDSLVGGVGRVESPKGEAMERERETERDRDRDRDRERSCVGEPWAVNINSQPVKRELGWPLDVNS